MIGAVMGGLRVAGGLAGFMSGRKQQKWGRRKAARAQAKADERLQQMDGLLDEMGRSRDAMMNTRGQMLQQSDAMDAFSEGMQGVVDQQGRVRQDMAGTRGAIGDLRGELSGMRGADQDRLARLGFDEVEQQLADQVRAGVDGDQRAAMAAGEFTNQFDTSLDASRRAMARQGVRPGSAAAARLEEDAAFNRARGAAGAASAARREADDLAFARRVAFAGRGDALRSSIRGQMGQEAGLVGQEFGMQGTEFGQLQQEFANRGTRYAHMGDRYNRMGNDVSVLRQVNDERRGEFGAQGQIRGEYLGERNSQQARAQAGTDAMIQGAASIGKGMLGGAASGAFGGGAQTQAMNFIRPEVAMQGR